MPIKLVKHRININNDYYIRVFVFKRNRSMYLTKKNLKELHLIRWLDKALTQTLLDIDNLKMNNLWKQAFTFFKVKLSQQVLKTFPVDKKIPQKK